MRRWNGNWRVAARTSSGSEGRNLIRGRLALLREALDRYLADANRAVREVVVNQDEADAIRRGREDLASGRTVRLEDLRNEMGLATR